MFIVKFRSTVIKRTTSLDVAIAALRSFLDLYPKVNDYEVEIERYN